ncbi:hypothetical protein [Pseudomonas sp. GV071]|uniref:hypothetical protein n=1 Tax=Pseudomonas sp. GV071 TaxID=2135754 RepID=UPI000D3C663B|nr:hypothetical protein [Pseudomonas sp. GV071]PTQ70296.1 hypothetical protein C8K61_10618 [Pseudomonas sp. GV071]
MSAVLTGLDAGLCLLVVLAALDYLRRVHIVAQPLLSLTFYLVAITVFGALLHLLYGYPLSASHSTVSPAGECRFLINRQEPR